MELNRNERQFNFRKLIFIFLMLGSFLTLFSVNDVHAESANNIGFTPDDPTWNVDNVNDALNGIYGMLIKDQCLSTLESDKGTLSPIFDPLVTEYDLNLRAWEANFTLSGTHFDEGAVVTGLNQKISVGLNKTKTVEVTVTSSYGEVRVYTIHAKRNPLQTGEHTSKLENVVINDGVYELDDFDPLVYDYNLIILSSEPYLRVDPVKLDTEATTNVTGNNPLQDEQGTITVSVSEPNSEDTTYTINYTKVNFENKSYEYTGEYQTFIAPKNGVYKIELWGAQGGHGYSNNGSNFHSNGAYTSGKVRLAKDTRLYVYVGSAGQSINSRTSASGGYNGGGNGSLDTNSSDASGAGGGATDVRAVSGLWNNEASLKSRIMVAAGGGGLIEYSGSGTLGDITGAHAGGLYASGNLRSWSEGNYTLDSSAVNQTTGYAFGQGQNGITAAGAGGGAGSGWYGGVNYLRIDCATNGSGGSSYISGHTGCVGITSKDDKTPKSGCTTGTSDNNCSLSPYNYSFTETKMVDGAGYNWTNVKEEKIGMPTTDGTSLEYGHSGNGYAKIKLISDNNNLASLTTNHGTLSPAFSPLTDEYNLTLTPYEKSFSLSGEVADEYATVTGFDETYKVSLGQTKTVNITVTAENGDVRIYKIHAKRNQLGSGEHSSKLDEIIINNGDYELEDYQPSTNEYTINILGGEVDLNIETYPYDSEANVSIIGNKNIKTNTGAVTITVTEPHVETTVYTINYIKNVELESTVYSCDKQYKTFTSQWNLNYKVELWGASAGAGYATYGGYAGSGDYGHGAYTSGTLKMDKGEKLYVYVGCAGTRASSMSSVQIPGWNGGGTSYGSTDNNDYAGSGGGATDIRLLPTSNLGTWNEIDSLRSRIMVAGGGGGGNNTNTTNYTEGMNAGGLKVSGYLTRWTSYWAPVVTQTTGYQFGVGQDGGRWGLSAGGGGGGYYGGIASSTEDGGKSSGGTSFISGHKGSVAISSSTSITPKTVNGTRCDDGTTDIECSYHYSGKIFKDTKMIDGTGYKWDYKRRTQIGMPTIDGTGTENGHSGDGYAKITPVYYSKNNYLDSLASSYGMLSPTFDPTKNNYTLTLGKYDRTFTLSGVVSDPKATVIGLDEQIEIDEGETKTIEVAVTAESGDVRVYTISATRARIPSGEHSSKLSKLEVKTYEGYIEPEFNALVEEYTLDVTPNEAYLELETETFDPEATVTITGNEYLIEDTGIITITVTEPHVASTVYTINIAKERNFDTNEFDYTGNYQIFEAPWNLTYKFETWGAQGGRSRCNGDVCGAGGYGGYSVGKLQMNKGEKVYIYVGQKGYDSWVGGNTPTAWNGGGLGTYDYSDDDSSGSGGGATDIRYFASEPDIDDLKWNSSLGLRSRIMVAGGGGGALWSGTGGSGGGFTGGSTGAAGATQTSGNDFGVGQNASGSGSCQAGSPGGGGGYYGGRTINACDSASGGSGFVSGLTGSVAIESEDSQSPKTVNGVQCSDGTTIKECSYHYSGKVFTEADTKNGQRAGAGYAKVTPMLLDRNNYLDLLRTDIGIWDREFDPLVNEYHVTLGVDDTKIKIEAKPSADTSTIEGLGEHMVPGGEQEYEVKVTSESGDERIYKIITERPKSSEARARNITITGLVENICARGPEFCVQDPMFDMDQDIYTMMVPAGIKELEFTVEKMHDYEEVVGEGVTKLNAGDNTITIEITSEDGEVINTYMYEITRDITGDNYLDNLKIHGIDEDGNIKEDEIDIGFNYLVTEYAFKVTNDITSLDLNIVLDDPDAEYRVLGNENFVVGNNVVEIEVTAQDGEIRNYVLNVYRVSNDNNLLQSLRVMGNDNVDYALNPEFKDIEFNYGVNVPNTVTSVTVTGIPQKETSSVDGNGIYELHTGINEVNILVTSESGLIETYKVLVTRAYNSNNYLSSLSAIDLQGNEQITGFNSAIQEYEMTVEAHNKSLNITYIPEVETSKVRIEGNKNFKIGENIVKVIVEAENKGIREYILKVNKEGSDNDYLSNLSVIGNNSEYITNFNKETMLYELSMPNSVKKVKVNGILEDNLSKVTGNGEYKLVSGLNEINVKVTSETGIERIYTIRITRDYGEEPRLRTIELSAGTLEPVFNSDTEDYEVVVPFEVKTLTITGKLIDETGTVIGNGEKTLIVGENNFVLKGISEDGQNEKEYRIKITRGKNTNNYLKSLNVREGMISPKFNKNTQLYTVKVGNSVDSVHIDATPEAADSDVMIEYLTPLEEGENELHVTVTSASGAVRVYTVKVIRQRAPSNSLFLNTLDVTSCTIDFNKNVNYYECSVPNEVKKVTVTATSEDELNTIEGTGEYDLITGENFIGVKVINIEDIENDYVVKITREKSTESRLKNIRVVGHNLNELFDKDIYEYTLTTDDDELEFDIEKMDEGETYEIIGNSFVLGENTLVIRTTSEDGENHKEYTITVTRILSSNAYLADLRVQDHTLTPEFNKGVYEYSVDVENEEASVIVKGYAEKIHSVVEGLGMHTVDVGENIIEVKVTSETGNEKVYRITVNRKRNDNNYLSSLVVKDINDIELGMSPAFDKDVLNYNMEVEYTTGKVKIEAEPERGETIVSGDGEVDLVRGINIKKVIVTAEDGSIKVYEIKINRKNPITSLLENIEVKDYKLDPGFESNRFNYSVTVNYETTSLDLIITKLDPKSTYVISGNSEFKVGLNEVKIKSIASNNSETSTYTLTVNRQIYANNFLKNIIVRNMDGEVYELSPEFEKYTLTYKVQAEEWDEKVKIEASAENEGNLVEGTGIKTIAAGTNKFEIIVTASNGIKRIYNVIVNKGSSKDTGIIDLRTTKGELTKVNRNHYTLLLDNAETELRSNEVIVTPSNRNAEVIKEEKIIIREDNQYNIRVISADGSEEEEYIIEVVFIKSSDGRLKSLVPSTGDLSPAFNKDVTVYTLSVFDIDTEVEFEAEPLDENAHLINESLLYNLENYETNANIEVEAEDGSEKVYKIKIQKSKTIERLPNNIIVTGKNEICESCTYPVFNETTYEYNFNVPYETKELNIEVIKKHNAQKIKVYKNGVEVDGYTLDVGENEYEIEIENSLGEKTRYKYNVERLRSTNNYLSSLRVVTPETELDKEFNKNELEYNIMVGYEYENIEIEAIPEDTENARVTIKGTTYLLEGNNDVSIKVKAGNGDVREYIIHVLRLPRSNNLLRTLTISSGVIYELTPKFTPGVMDYKLEVGSVISKIEVEGVPLDSEAIVNGNGEYELSPGVNKIELEVVATDGEKRKYRIEIKREASKNAYLSKLVANNGIFQETFNKEQEKYHIEVEKDVERLSLDLQTEDPNATYEIFGNEGFTKGENIVKIKVTSADRSTAKTYVLYVRKRGEDNAKLIDIKVNNESIENFNDLVRTYELEVENDVTSINVRGIPEELSTIVQGNGDYGLEVGVNTITVKGISEEGTEEEYTLNIRRKKNTYLMLLIPDKGSLDPVFEKHTENYTIELDTEIENLTVIGIAEDIGNATVQGNDKYNLNIGENTITLKVVNGEDSRDYVLNVIRKGSDNNNLKYLRVNEGMIEPDFDKDTLNYEVHVPSDIADVTLEAIAEDSNAIVTIENTQEGKNIKVISSSGKEKIYTINVIKEDASYFSNKLLELSVNKGTLSPRFDSDTLSYTVTVGNTVKDIRLSAVRESLEATVEGLGVKELAVGRNVLPIKVTSKDGKERVYQVIVYRSSTLDARLEKLVLENGRISPSFSKNQFTYTVNVDSEEEILKIKEIKAIEDDARIDIGSLILNTETKRIEIKVSIEDKNKTYVLNVKKVKSTNAYLKELDVSTGTLTPEFTKNKNVYTLTVGKNAQSVLIEGTPESTKASVQGNGLYEVEDNKVISLVVTAESGNINTYTITIEKEEVNTWLKDLRVKGYNIGYAENKTNYELEVESSVEEVIIEGETYEGVTVTGFGIKELETGENSFEVIATNKDGKVRVYNIVVTRKKEKSNKIKKLSFKEGELSPEFNKDINSYTLRIPYEKTSVTELIELEDENASYTITGNTNLGQGDNVVNIKVSRNGLSDNTYQVRVVREQLTNNYLKTLKVKKKDGTIVTLTPTFEKTEVYYEATVSNNTEKVVIEGEVDLDTTTVEGLGEKSLEKGENIIIIKTKGSSGVERIYKININREKDTNNYLSNLEVEDYDISPVFEKTHSEYEVTIDSEEEKINIIGQKENELSSVSGLGIVPITGAEEEKDIVVTAENGSVRVYKLTVKRGLSSNKNLIKLEPSTGSLSPEYDDTVDNYEITIPKNTNLVDLDIETASKKAKVIGTTRVQMTENQKQVTITIEAEDKSTREITITIKKQSGVTEIRTQKDEITLVKGEEKDLEYEVLPSTVTNKEVDFEYDDEIISVANNKVTGLKAGGSTLKITSRDNRNVSKTITVNVVLNEIQSDEYTVEEKTDPENVKIVIGAEVGETIKDFKDKLLNNEDTINIYNKEGNKLTNTDTVQTGLIIKLEVEGHEYDSAIMIVRGDLNEDGEVNISDRSILTEHILKKALITNYIFYAADLAEDYGEIDASDSSQLNSYLLKKIESLN